MYVTSNRVGPGFGAGCADPTHAEQPRATASMTTTCGRRLMPSWTRPWPAQFPRDRNGKRSGS